MREVANSFSGGSPDLKKTEKTEKKNRFLPTKIEILT